MKSNYKKQLKNIKAFVFDVDGVLTNGGLIIYPNGKFKTNECKRWLCYKVSN